jgi:hypothetical protein
MKKYVYEREMSGMVCHLLFGNPIDQQLPPVMYLDFCSRQIFRCKHAHVTHKFFGPGDVK